MAIITLSISVHVYQEGSMAFEWLDKIFDKILSSLPSIMIVDSTEAGVAYWFGKPSSIKSSSVFIYFPMLCEVDVRKTCKQCIDCRTQAVLTKDGKSISIGVVVQYRVTDPLKAFCDYDDLDTYIPPLAMSVAAEVMREREMPSIMKGGELVDDLTKLLRKRLYNSGVEIINVFINELVPCRVVRLITNAPVMEDAE